MVRLRGRARARGNRRGGPVRAAVGGRGAGRGGGGARGGSNRNMRGGPFTAPLMGRPRPPIMPSLRYGEPDYGYGPRIPPMMPPPMPGPRGLMGRPYAPPVPIPPVPYPRGRPFPGDYPVRHSMGLPPVPPRPMLPPVPPVPPFIRGRGGFRGGMTKSGKVYNNGLMTKGKTNKKKNAKAKRNEQNAETIPLNFNPFVVLVYYQSNVHCAVCRSSISSSRTVFAYRPFLKEYHKRHMSLEAEINKPWVNNALKVEIQKKHRLFEEASQKHSDTVCWKAYNEQKAFVTNLVNRAKLDYIGSHSEEEVSKIPELKTLLEAKKNENKSTTEVAVTA